MLGLLLQLVTQLRQSQRQVHDVLSAAESVPPISDSEVTCGPVTRPATLSSSATSSSNSTDFSSSSSSSSTSAKCLSVLLSVGKSFGVELHHAKCKFYASFNSVFHHVARFQNELVVLHLVSAFCRPHFLYVTECCNFNITQQRSHEHTWCSAISHNISHFSYNWHRC